MSGSGGGGGGGFPDVAVACEDLVIHTQLSSPIATVVKTLGKGDVLQVELEAGPITTLVVVKHHGVTAGGLASARIVRLIECINAGTRYRATVVDAVGGQVRLKVEAVR